MNTAVINYAMYEGKEEYVGLTRITLPSLEMFTQTVTGSGIGGELESVLIGQLKAMSMDVELLVLSRQGISLAEQREHTWEFREVQQTMDQTTKEAGVEAVKHVIKAFPKQMDAGTLTPQSTSNPKISAAVHYWAEYRDGELVLELDPAAMRCYINGKDYLEPVRTAMGK